MRPGDEERLRGVERLASLLDDCFRIPGTDLRFGLDPIIGLIPGAGDGVSAMLGLYLVYQAWRLGVPTSLLARMVGNLFLDWLVGSVPMVGDLFDAAFKAHRRNARLMRRWLDETRPV